MDIILLSIRHGPSVFLCLVEENLASAFEKLNVLSHEVYLLADLIGHQFHHLQVGPAVQVATERLKTM